MKRLVLILVLIYSLFGSTANASVLCTGDTQWLSSTTVPVTAQPMTISIWFRSAQEADRAASDMLVWVGDNAASGTWFSVGIYRLGVNRISAWDRVQDTDSETNSSDYVLFDAENTWWHVVARFDSVSQRRIAVTGNSSTFTAQNTVTQPSITGIDEIAICSARDSSPGNFWNGRIAEVAIWDVSISDTDVTSLSGGANPLAIDATNLIAYWPLKTDANDVKGSNNLTNNGSATFDSGNHPTIDAPPGGGSTRKAVAPIYQ